MSEYAPREMRHVLMEWRDVDFYILQIMQIAYTYAMG